MREQFASDTMETWLQRERPKEGDMKVPSGLWEKEQKMWVLGMGRDSSRGQLAEKDM